MPNKKPKLNKQPKPNMANIIELRAIAQKAKEMSDRVFEILKNDEFLSKFDEDNGLEFSNGGSDLRDAYEDIDGCLDRIDEE